MKLLYLSGLFLLTINIFLTGNEIRLCPIRCMYKFDVKDIAKTFCSDKIFKENTCTSTIEKGCMSYYFESQVIDGVRINFEYSGCYDEKFVEFARKWGFKTFEPNLYTDSSLEYLGYNFYAFGSRNTIVKTVKI
uniref:Uncharacterized protein n=1 Tax=Parastrongyloides trichosuri TaxID=131310 RepID=A0A0N4ZJ57_PARTI